MLGQEKSSTKKDCMRPWPALSGDNFEKFSAVLKKGAAPVSCYADYRKWLRFYLDFCHKYCHRYVDRESLKQFIR